jgi:hypothetical protein
MQRTNCLITIAGLTGDVEPQNDVAAEDQNERPRARIVERPHHASKSRGPTPRAPIMVPRRQSMRGK